MLADEQARAELYRQQLTARGSAQRSRCALLTGNPAMRSVLTDAWAPWTDPPPSAPDPVLPGWCTQQLP